MHDTAVIALKLTDEVPVLEADYIGADKGALFLAGQGIRMRFAVGDFDSVEEKDLAMIREYADEVIRLNPVKNDSDSESAVRHCLACGYRKIIVCGPFGGRIDHAYVNLRLASLFPGTVELRDSRNRVICCGEGKWEFGSSYRYISFFADPEAEVTLKGMKYPLQHTLLTADDIYTLSNEITGDIGEIIVHRGRIIVMQCRD